MNILIYILAFALLLGVLVTIHEYGHFIVARLCKVHVQRFSIGMGPVFYKRKDKYGTEFALSAVPLGGYVSMITNKLIEHEPEVAKSLNEDQLKNTFDSKPKWQRALIMFAGPLANFILAIVIFTFFNFMTLDQKLSPVIVSVDKTINYLSAESFQVNDKIISINDRSLKEPKDLQLELITYGGHSGDLNFIVSRPNVSQPISIPVNVLNFLPTSESQQNPIEYLGLKVDYKGDPIIGSVLQDGPAFNAGFKTNDRVLEIGNVKINYVDDIKLEISKNPNTKLDFKIERNGDTLYLPTTTSFVETESGTMGMIGVGFGSKRTFLQSLSLAIYETYNLSIKTIQFIGKMITGNLGTQNLSGPIGIAQMAGDTAQMGVLPFLYLMALLSISLGVLNLLPIPVLDGGQLTLLGIEAIRGKPLPEKAENIIYTGGAILVGMLMIFAITNDVLRFF